MYSCKIDLADGGLDIVVDSDERVCPEEVRVRGIKIKALVLVSSIKGTWFPQLSGNNALLLFVGFSS